MRKLLLLLIAVFIPAVMLIAQQPFDGRIILKDGDVLRGRITQMQGHYPEVYKVQTAGEIRYVFQSQIERIDESGKFVPRMSTQGKLQQAKLRTKAKLRRTMKHKEQPPAFELGPICSGYVELMNIFNFADGDLYSLGLNLSLGKEWRDRLYVGGGLSCYYATDFVEQCRESEEYVYNEYLGYDEPVTHYYNDKHDASGYSMDFFADIRYKFTQSRVTPVAGFKLGIGFNLTGHDGLNIVTRPSFGLLIRLRGHSELLLNVEYVPLACYELNPLSLNLGYKFGW